MLIKRVFKKINNKKKNNKFEYKLNFNCTSLNYLKKVFK